MIFLIFTTVFIILLFIFSFIKLVKNNSFEYISILVFQFIGIFIDFVVILNGKKPSNFVYVIVYFLSVFIPICVLILEQNRIYLGEFTLFINKDLNKETILKIIERHPESYRAHKKLAEYYIKNMEKEKAEDEYIRVIKLKPDEYENYCILADLFLENNKTDDAIQVLEEVLRLKKDYCEASLRLGNILYDNNNFKEAILVLNEALKYNPKEYYLYYYLGMNYTRINDFNNAKECYKKAAVLNSIKDISNLNAGQIYLIFEDYDKAEEYFFKTIDSEDDEILANSYFYLSKIRLIQKNENQAIQYANLAIEFNPEIIKRMENDELFIPILGKLRLKGKDSINTKISEKDKNIIEHLSKTFNIVETLTNDFQRSEAEEDMDIDTDVDKEFEEKN